MKKNKTFEVLASETVFYRFHIDADSEEQAREEVMNGNVELEPNISASLYCPSDNSADFNIESVKELL